MRHELLASVAALAAMTLPPRAAQAAAGYSVQAMTVDVVVGPDDDNRCRVDADLYRPDGVSAANPAPAILATNGFGGDKTGLAAIAGSYAKRGYVFLAYSGLGFGKSGCQIGLDDPDWDGKAGRQLVSLLGGSKTAIDGKRIDFVLHDATAHDGKRYDDDPRVGMLNGSYGGAIQFAWACRPTSASDTWETRTSASLRPPAGHRQRRGHRDRLRAPGADAAGERRTGLARHDRSAWNGEAALVDS